MDNFKDLLSFTSEFKEFLRYVSTRFFQGLVRAENI